MADRVGADAGRSGLTVAVGRASAAQHRVGDYCTTSASTGGVTSASDAAACARARSVRSANMPAAATTKQATAPIPSPARAP